MLADTRVARAQPAEVMRDPKLYVEVDVANEGFTEDQEKYDSLHEVWLLQRPVPLPRFAMGLSR